MSEDIPKVTIAIPTLNRVGYLRLALESALAQNYGNLEVVVSNNASSDATASYLASCKDTRLRVLSHTTTISMVENWNACLHAATGEFFLLLSDDDLLESDAICELVAAYTPRDDMPVPGMVYGGSCFIDSYGDVTMAFKPAPGRETAHDFLLAYLSGKRSISFCAVLLRTVEMRPGFPSEYNGACDVALWMRILIRSGSVSFVSKGLARYRIHQSLTFTTPLKEWRQLRNQLYELLFSEENRTGSPDLTFIRRLQLSMRRSDLSLIAGWINGSFSQKKAAALLAYIQHLPAFLHPSGLEPLGRGLLGLLLSSRTKQWLRRRFRDMSARVS